MKHVLIAVAMALASSAPAVVNPPPPPGGPRPPGEDPCDVGRRQCYAACFIDHSGLDLYVCFHTCEWQYQACKLGPL